MLVETIIIGLVALVAVLVAVTFIASARWKHATTRKLDNGSHVAQTSAGPVEYAIQGDGSPVLILHGSPGGYDQGMFLAGFLKGANRQFIVPSRPGYLRTPLEVGKTFEAQADACAALLDALAVERAAIVGVSGGGPIALQLALRHPERVSTLVLASAVTGQMRIPVETMNNLLARTDAGNWLMLNLFHLIPKMLGNEIASDSELRAKTMPLIETTFPLSLRHAGLMNDAEQLEHLAQYPLQDIGVPALVVHGSADTNVPLAHAEWAASAIPGAEWLMIENGQHGFSTLNAEALARIRQFLDTYAKPLFVGLGANDGARNF